MNESARSLIQQIRTVITDPARRALVCDVLRLSILAIEQLSVLDETIYETAAEEELTLVPDDPRRAAITEAVFRQVHHKTFLPVRRLCAYFQQKRLLGNLDKVLKTAPETPDVERSFDAAFDTTAVPTPSASSPDATVISNPALEELDKAFEAIASTGPDLMTAYSTFVEHIEIIGHQIVRQAERFDKRIAHAIEVQKFELALREIDMSRQSLSEGLFVLVCDLFRAFGMIVEREQIVPTYKNAVEQSILLRTGLAELEELVAGENDWVIQDPSMPEQDVKDGLARIARELQAFLSGPLRVSLRTPDRMELESFLRKLRQPSLPAAVLACEGLSKYLSSLRIISQREVLLQHDANVIDEIRENLEAARSLLSVSPATASQLLGEGLEKGINLRGRNSRFDEFMDQWALAEDNIDDEKLRQMIETLDELLR